jgi:hypothetical protein
MMGPMEKGGVEDGVKDFAKSLKLQLRILPCRKEGPRAWQSVSNIHQLLRTPSTISHLYTNDTANSPFNLIFTKILNNSLHLGLSLSESPQASTENSTIRGAGS